MVAPTTETKSMTRKATNKAKTTEAARTKSAVNKLTVLTELMRRPTGATLEELTFATGWQAHSVRGAISGSIKKTMGLGVLSQKVEGVRRYSIASDAA